MSSIYKISEALKTHLSRGRPFTVELKDPTEKNPPADVSVWLYQVQPDEFSRNASPPVVEEGRPNGIGGLTKRKQSIVPPCGINLHYLVTPLIGNALSDHDVLGRMLLTIHESPLIRVPDPQLDQDEQIRIILPAETLEDRVRLWDSLKSIPYRLSFTCVLRTARLYSSMTMEEAPVLSFSSGALPEPVGS